jgi:metal-responsive CopG/Arc/MetJ family transcriptional regulator
MKTAISLDGDLLQQADKTAQQMGLSRSRLFALALRDYLRRNQQQQLVEQLNRVYAGKLDLSDKQITRRMKNKFRATIKDRW